MVNIKLTPYIKPIFYNTLPALSLFYKSQRQRALTIIIYLSFSMINSGTSSEIIALLYHYKIKEDKFT